jgi:hypothetical protein
MPVTLDISKKKFGDLIPIRPLKKRDKHGKIRWLLR